MPMLPEINVYRRLPQNLMGLVFYLSHVRQIQVFTLFKTNLRENVKLGTLDRSEHVAAY